MASTENQENEEKTVYRTIFGAEVLWPLDCPDDILEAVIKEIKNLETEQKMAIDKDGQKVQMCVIFRLLKALKNS